MRRSANLAPDQPMTDAHRGCVGGDPSHSTDQKSIDTQTPAVGGVDTSAGLDVCPPVRTEKGSELGLHMADYSTAADIDKQLRTLQRAADGDVDYDELAEKFAAEVPEDQLRTVVRLLARARFLVAFRNGSRQNMSLDPFRKTYTPSAPSHAEDPGPSRWSVHQEAWKVWLDDVVPVIAGSGKRRGSLAVSDIDVIIERRKAHAKGVILSFQWWENTKAAMVSAEVETLDGLAPATLQALYTAFKKVELSSRGGGSE